MESHQLLRRLWASWSKLFDRMPDWFFASPPDSPQKPPKQKKGQSIDEFKIELDRYLWDSEQKKIQHDETSNTIRKVFLTLSGTCLFCVIAATSTPDVHLLTPTATVKLPMLSYEMGFEAFLIVGPIVLITLTLYLHIFYGQHREHQIALEIRQPMLPNLSSVTAKITVVVVFYWMVPFTLAVFTVKALPRPTIGPLLALITVLVTAALVLLQARRCPRKWRAWAVPLLLTTFVFFVTGGVQIAENRQLNLIGADLSEKDLQRANLSGANLQKANLRGADLVLANLREAELAEADLRGANLRGTDLRQANLREAKLDNEPISENVLGEAALSKASPKKVDLRDAKLNAAVLIQANLSGADLRGAHLNEAILAKANLRGADLRGAHLKEAILAQAKLRGADLRGANDLIQSQLDMACGDDATKLPDGRMIETCK